MISKRIIYIVMGILIFIVVSTLSSDCALPGSHEELEWQKSKKLAEGMSEEEAAKAAKKVVEKDLEEIRELEYDSDDDPYPDYEDEEEELEEYEKEFKEREEIRQAVEEAELEEGFEEEEKLLPNEPITYYGDFDGVDITLLINFKTTVVSGLVSSGGDQYVDAAIDGTIDIETFKVMATFSGVMGSKEAGIEESLNGTINGTVTGDLKNFNGSIYDDEGAGGEFKAWTAYE